MPSRSDRSTSEATRMEVRWLPSDQLCLRFRHHGSANRQRQSAGQYPACPYSTDRLAVGAAPRGAKRDRRSIGLSLKIAPAGLEPLPALVVGADFLAVASYGTCSRSVLTKC